MLNKLYWGIGCIIVISALVFAFNKTGGPENQRHHKLDKERLDRLSAIYNGIKSYYDEKHTLTKQLPKQLNDLLDQNKYYLDKDDLVDPETETLFEYHILTPTRFELCATFQTDHQTLSENHYPPTLPGSNEKVTYWGLHPEGKHCFPFDTQTHYQTYYFND
jgi:hypothetical protein